MHIWVSVYLDHADPRIALHHPVAFAVGKAEWTDFGDDSRRLCVADENRKWMAQSTARVASPGCCELGCLAKNQQKHRCFSYRDGTRQTCLSQATDMDMDISENAMSLGPQEVQEVHKVTADPLNLESAMVLQIPEEFPGSGVSGVRKVARLLTHCSPKKYLNFKVKMFETEDLDFVGGELGSAPRKSHLSLFSAKLNSMVMQTDTEFQAKLGVAGSQMGPFHIVFRVF